MTDDAEAPSSGSVAHTFRNRLFWHWADTIPRDIPGGFIATLYAMSAAADPAGVLRFNTGGKTISLTRIARGARVDVKDCRRYVRAAIAAGLVHEPEDPQKGRAVVYRLSLCPLGPDWGAAQAALKSSRRVRVKADPPPWGGENLGGPTPQVHDNNLGGPTPQVPHDPDHSDGSEPRGTDPLPTWGDLPPRGWGDRPPTIPGFSMSSSMTGADRVPQPPVGVGPARRKIIPGETDGTGWGTEATRCAVCFKPMVARHGRTTHRDCEEHQ